MIECPVRQVPDNFTKIPGSNNNGRSVVLNSKAFPAITPPKRGIIFEPLVVCSVCSIQAHADRSSGYCRSWSVMSMQRLTLDQCQLSFFFLFFPSLPLPPFFSRNDWMMVSTLGFSPNGQTHSPDQPYLPEDEMLLVSCFCFCCSFLSFFALLFFSSLSLSLVFFFFFLFLSFFIFIFCGFYFPCSPPLIFLTFSTLSL